MTTEFHILGISGSLRQGSHNTSLLRAMGAMLPATAGFELAEIGDLPLYDGDLGEVDAVERVKKQIAAADALLIATPEYNYSVPGVLKNALDWASRPAYQSVFVGKPTGIVGAAGSGVGTARAQAHLKTIMLGMLAEVFPWPELLVSRASNVFDDGRLVDDVTRSFVSKFTDGFVDWSRRRAEG